MLMAVFTDNAISNIMTVSASSNIIDNEPEEQKIPFFSRGIKELELGRNGWNFIPERLERNPGLIGKSGPEYPEKRNCIPSINKQIR
jgi:hypothetical protein